MEYNPFLPEYLENPYPMYHRLRAEDPVHRGALTTPLRRMPRLRLQSETAHWRPTSALRGLPVAF